MIAIEMIEKLKKEELASITVLSGEDFGQYGQMKKLFFNKIGIVLNMRPVIQTFVMLISVMKKLKKISNPIQ